MWEAGGGGVRVGRDREQKARAPTLVAAPPTPEPLPNPGISSAVSRKLPQATYVDIAQHVRIKFI